MMRKHIDELQIEVLIVGDDSSAVDFTKKLKTLMVKHYDPEWNRPAANRVKLLREGRLT